MDLPVTPPFTIATALAEARRFTEAFRPSGQPLRLTCRQVESVFLEQGRPLPEDWDAITPSLSTLLGVPVELIDEPEDTTPWEHRTR